MQSEHRLLFSVDLREKNDHAMIWKSDEFISINANGDISFKSWKAWIIHDE